MAARQHESCAIQQSLSCRHEGRHRKAYAFEVKMMVSWETRTNILVPAAPPDILKESVGSKGKTHQDSLETPFHISIASSEPMAIASFDPLIPIWEEASIPNAIPTHSRLFMKMSSWLRCEPCAIFSSRMLANLLTIWSLTPLSESDLGGMVAKVPSTWTRVNANAPGAPMPYNWSYNSYK